MLGFDLAKEQSVAPSQRFFSGSIINYIGFFVRDFKK
jgi:hypothetical protein